jgi:hypothetical protein
VVATLEGGIAAAGQGYRHAGCKARKDTLQEFESVTTSQLTIAIAASESVPHSAHQFQIQHITSPPPRAQQQHPNASSNKRPPLPALTCSSQFVGHTNIHLYRRLSVSQNTSPPAQGIR